VQHKGLLSGVDLPSRRLPACFELFLPSDSKRRCAAPGIIATVTDPEACQVDERGSLEYPHDHAIPKRRRMTHSASKRVASTTRRKRRGNDEQDGTSSSASDAHSSRTAQGMGVLPCVQIAPRKKVCRRPYCRLGRVKSKRIASLHHPRAECRVMGLTTRSLRATNLCNLAVAFSLPTSVSAGSEASCASQLSGLSPSRGALLKDIKCDVAGDRHHATVGLLCA
jgi:hypothetical protein